MAPENQVNTPTELTPGAVIPVDDAPTMSSMEIAELCEARHNDVIATIQRLFEQGVLRESRDTLREHRRAEGGRPTRVYDLTKRDTLVVASGYNAKLRARIIDRWEEAERQLRARTVVPDFRDPDFLLKLVVGYAQDKKALLGQVAEMEVTVAAFDQIADASGSMCVRDTAKHLGLGQKALYEWLRLNKWTYRRVGMAHDLAYQDKIVSGLMEHKVSTVHHPDGEDRIRTQARVTAKGLARLAKLLRPTATLVAHAA